MSEQDLLSKMKEESATRKVKAFDYVKLGEVFDVYYNSVKDKFYIRKKGMEFSLLSGLEEHGFSSELCVCSGSVRADAFGNCLLDDTCDGTASGGCVNTNAIADGSVSNFRGCDGLCDLTGGGLAAWGTGGGNYTIQPAFEDAYVDATLVTPDNWAW